MHHSASGPHSPCSAFYYCMTTFINVEAQIHFVTCNISLKSQLHLSFGVSDTIYMPEQCFYTLTLQPVPASASCKLHFYIWALSRIRSLPKLISWCVSLLSDLCVCMLFLAFIKLHVINYNFFDIGDNMGEHVCIEIFHRT